MLIRILDNLLMRLEAMSATMDKLIAERFSLQVPNAHFIDVANWDGVVRKYDSSRQQLSRALLRELLKFLIEKDIPFEIQDDRPPSQYSSTPIEELKPDLLPGITLEEYQMRSIRATYVNEIGIINLPTGAGKTEVAAGIVKVHKRPTVIIAEQIIVVQQIKSRLELRDIVEEVGVFCAGKIPTGQDVIVGSIASLCIPGRPKIPVKPTLTQAQAYVKAAKLSGETEISINRQRYLIGGSLAKHVAKQIGELLEAGRDCVKIDGVDYSLGTPSFATHVLPVLTGEVLIDILLKIKESKDAKNLVVDGVDWPTVELTDELMMMALERQHLTNLKRYETSVRAYKTRVKNAKLLRALVAKCDMLLVDECDKASGKQYKNLFKSWFKGRLIYGFSGTPFDESKPVEELEIKDRLGSIIASESRKTVENLGRTIPVDCYMLVNGPDARDERSAYDVAYADRVVHNPDFHQRVKGIVDGFEGDATLILVDRDALGEALKELIPGSCFIHGKTAKKKRDRVLTEFEQRKFNVLIGGKILARGLDLKGGCNNIIITTGGQLRQEYEQKIGRGLRVNAAGICRIIDFYHINNVHLYKHSRARLKIMVDLKYRTTVVYDDGHIPGEELIRLRFRRPRQLPGKS